MRDFAMQLRSATQFFARRAAIAARYIQYIKLLEKYVVLPQKNTQI
ncbi:MAG TPA: hypothetical protein VM661_05085 [Candidatus Sulfotelmatobacter sp.]|nr:hypothetical protein [Candidatus Sulfotelmatobacter sp.]